MRTDGSQLVRPGSLTVGTLSVLVVLMVSCADTWTRPAVVPSSPARAWLDRKAGVMVGLQSVVRRFASLDRVEPVPSFGHLVGATPSVGVTPPAVERPRPGVRTLVIAGDCVLPPPGSMIASS